MAAAAAAVCPGAEITAFDEHRTARRKPVTVVENGDVCMPV